MGVLVIGAGASGAAFAWSIADAGDVFGEMAFLLERPRSRDVYAATDGVRVLSLSEAKLRKMVEVEPANAAQLLLNISKMLCLRILKEG